MAESIKKYYNKEVKDIDYESKRWFKDKASKEQYEETKKTVLFNLENKKFGEVMEVGCGPGTWTKLLKDYGEKLTLVDISKEMLKQAKKNLNNKKIKYICSDFETIKIRNKFDLFFSSRAIEYMKNKRKVIKKVYDLLEKDGEVMIITKNPWRRWKHIIFKNKVEEIHKDWISIREIKEIMEEIGFKVEINPAVFSILPFSNFYLTRKLNKLIHGLCYKKQVKFIELLFLESYFVHAYKS